MKRKLIGLLFVCMLFSGCGNNSSQPLQTESPTEESQQAQSQLPLLEQGNAVGESGNLLYIPNPYVETMACPEIRLLGNSLLLYEYTTEGVFRMKRISLEDGSLLAEASYPMKSYPNIQIGNGFVGLCDSGQVLILNEWLELEMTHAVPLEGEVWCLNQELETVYVSFEEGLISYELATGREYWLLDNAAFVQPFDMGSGYVLFSYTDQTDKKTYTRCLNLSTATLETLPVENLISSGVRYGERWLLRQNIDSGSYILVDQEEAVTFALQEGFVELISGRRQLLITDGSYRKVTAYDLKGQFLSRCSLPEMAYASVGTNFVWSGYWQGYFFRDTYENTAHLMFWNTDTEQAGEDLAMTPLETVQAPEAILEKELYQKAAELSQRFGLDIRIAEQCALDYSHYQADALVDPYLVRSALNILERAFSSYPEGFLHQLPYGTMQQIRIELVDNLRGKDGMDTHPVSIGGFAQENFDHYLIVFDSLTMDTQTVYHELSHVIDKHLEWDAILRPHALFSEESWLALQPKGFFYAHSYTDTPDEIAEYEDSGYFVNSYAMTFPTEDRATLMSLIMSDKTVLQENPGMTEKMRYYAACIRDCFDTAGWPETTLWEYVP